MRVRQTNKKALLAGLIAGLALMGMSSQALAVLPSPYSLYAEPGYINTPDGGETYAWGFSDQAGQIRYPGPTIDVKVGETVTIKLTNNLPDTDGNGPKTADPVSMVFAGQEGVTYSLDNINYFPVTPHLDQSGDRNSLVSVAPQAAPGQVIYYQFTPSKPGSFYYNSGTMPQKHIDMGLVGALIVRPAAFNPAAPQAYDGLESAYDVEYIQFLSAFDPDQHHRVELGKDYEPTAYLEQYWFINGRAFPDTIANRDVFYLPHQPDSALVGVYPRERALFRVINVDRQVHPLHHHGNHIRVVGINGHELVSSTGADLSRERFTETVNAGSTVDGIFTWDPNHDGQDFGWDVRGNDPTRPVPVDVPPVFDNPNIAFNYGETYSGSPYLGKKGLLPVVTTALSINQNGEHYVPYHSHHENELENQSARPGGMLTLIMICLETDPCFRPAP